ncbi:MAG TPA: hypothetical protein VNA69_09135 [Thermoanaerobaculia bacterium]|nr:hypothetical protein [Thermoanaerobaculia bacterium]
MILYRKAASLRIRRAGAPEPPFWCATTIAPYGARRGSPVAIDYLASRASAADRVEVPVCENVRDELERTRPITGPVLIEATESAEVVFRRGEEALAFCDEQRLGALYLTSTRGALPRGTYDDDVLAIAAWPVEMPRLTDLFAQARPARWGVVVPVLFPVTTDLETLDALAQSATEHGASFFAAMPLDVDATAKQAIAAELQLAGDDDRYAMLFHAELEPVHLATERHIAALAASHGMHDFVTPPQWDERSNWNAAALLMLTASRMIAMELDLDRAGMIARSARAVAELDKPLARVAEAASLSIIGAMDETSAEMVTEWLAGREAGFAGYVGEEWRLRRGMRDEG